MEREEKIKVSVKRREGREERRERRERKGGSEGERESASLEG